MTALPWLDADDDDSPFPDPNEALIELDGLLAAGGSLRPKRLLRAYRLGIFPWFSGNQPILWWSPDPRAVLFPERLKVSRSLRKTLRGGAFKVTLDHAFDETIRACAAPRAEGEGTWITRSMISAYSRLHRLGHAHSVESWQEGRLVGGLYGIAIGQVFFGESMFSRVSDASKVALVTLVERLLSWGYQLIDVQQDTAHLRSLGAETLSRAEFLRLLERHCAKPPATQAWAASSVSK